MHWKGTGLKSIRLGWSLLLFLSILLGCATTKEIEQTRVATEVAMKAAQEAAQKAETMAAKVEEGVREGNRAAARALQAAGIGERAAGRAEKR